MVISHHELDVWGLQSRAARVSAVRIQGDDLSDHRKP